MAVAGAPAVAASMSFLSVIARDLDAFAFPVIVPELGPPAAGAAAAVNEQ